MGKQLLLLGVLSASFGCAPIVENIKVSGAQSGSRVNHGERARVEAEITPTYGGAQTPTLGVKAHQPSGVQYAQAGQLDTRALIGPVQVPVDGQTLTFNKYRYQGALTQALEYGGYDLRVGVRYFSWLRYLETRVYSKFLVEAPAACFSFDHGAGFQGFSVDALKRHDGAVVRPVQALWDGTNWPYSHIEPAPGHGSFAFQIGRDFPKPPEENFYWFVDFVAPALAQRSEWSAATGVSLRLATRASHVYAQPILFLRDDTGAQRMFAPKDPASQKFMVYPLASSGAQEMAWQVVEWNPFPNGLPQKWFLEQVRLRIYGDANATPNNYDHYVYLDGVCPIPPGIMPPGGAPVTAIIGPWF